MAIHSTVDPNIGKLWETIAYPLKVYMTDSSRRL